MTVCPAIVDTIPAAMPENRNPTANSVAESELILVCKRLDKLYKSLKSPSWLNAAPAMISGAELTNRPIQKTARQKSHVA